jgi:putative membrane protein
MERRVHTALVLIGTLPVATPTYAQYYYGYGRAPMWDSDWGWGHMIFGSIFMLLVWGGIIVLVVLALRWMGTTWSSHIAPPSKTALDILKERFARGEIDKEEFEERKRLLSD